MAESYRVRGNGLQGTGSFGHEYYHATGTGKQPVLREWQGEYGEHEWQGDSADFLVGEPSEGSRAF